MLKLILELSGESAGEFELKEGSFVVGRSRSSDIRVNAPDISRAHMRVTVKGGSVIAENMSKHGTRLNGAFIGEPATLTHGCLLAMGNIAVLRFHDDSVGGVECESPEEFENMRTMPGMDYSKKPTETPAQDKTGEDVVTGRDDDAPDRTSADGASQSVPRTSFSMSTGSEHTQAMQTRLVSPEELETLRLTEQKRARKRILIIGAALIPLVVLGIIFRPVKRPPENEILWPRDAGGEYLDSYQPAPSGGYDEGGYSIFYPKADWKKVSAISGGVIVETRIGRDQDVPLRLILQEESDKRFLSMNREEMVRDWMEQVSSGNGAWNFDKPMMEPDFFGREKGVPFIRISYRRNDDKSWYGAVALFRNGEKRISMRAETPAEEQVRAANIVGSGFIMVSSSYQRSHWEPCTELPESDSAQVLREIRADLARMAPATWSEIEAELVAVLTKACMDGVEDIRKEALRLLEDLRTREVKWFNSQQFAWDNAIAQGDTACAMRIAACARAVFSDMEDRRYYTVRKWRINPEALEQ